VLEQTFFYCGEGSPIKANARTPGPHRRRSQHGPHHHYLTFHRVASPRTQHACRLPLALSSSFPSSDLAPHRRLPPPPAVGGDLASAQQPPLPLNPTLPNLSRCLPSSPTRPSRLRQRLRRWIHRPGAQHHWIHLHRPPRHRFLALATNPAQSTSSATPTGGTVAACRSAHTPPPPSVRQPPQPPSRSDGHGESPTLKPQTRTLRPPPSAATRARRRPAHQPSEL
jgi:hypothetical protein